MNRTGRRLLRSGLGLLLLLGLAAAAAWLIVQSRPRAPQAAQGSPLATPTARPLLPPSPTSRPPGPPPLPTQAAGRVPLCTFPGGPPPDRGGPGLEKYDFSEPRVVLTNTAAIAIAEWLPDNNRLLITRYESRMEHIETLDTRTSEIQLYAKRTDHHGKPIWLSAFQGVAYADIPSLRNDPRPTRPTVELRIGRTRPTETETIVTSEGGDGVLEFSLTADPSGRYLWYLMNRTVGRLQNWDSVAHTNQATPFDVNTWQRPSPDPTQVLWQYMVIPLWSSNHTRLAVFVGPSSLFLVEPGPDRVCEVNLGGRWPKAELSDWSPNARYLALVTADQVPSPSLGYTGVTVLDALSGEVRDLPLPKERGPAMDISWGGNSQHLLVLTKVTFPNTRPNQTKLFLADVVTGDVRQMLPDHLLGGGAQGGEQMAWARSGRLLAIKCPVVAEHEPLITEDRLCLISTELRP